MSPGGPNPTEPAPLPGAAKVTMKRDAGGNWAGDPPKERTVPAVEAAERPPSPDDGDLYFRTHGSDAG